jgi:hypothetical protein
MTLEYVVIITGRSVPDITVVASVVSASYNSVLDKVRLVNTFPVCIKFENSYAGCHLGPS